jgi:S1-C subfamily serine protease
MKQIIEQGHVVRGWLGIEAQDLTSQLAESFKMATTEGVLISGVLRNGPADDAGLLPGDVVISINNTPVTESREAMKIISMQPPDSAITLVVIRDGAALTVKPRVSKRPEQTLVQD